MNKVEIDYRDALKFYIEVLGDYGALLVANDTQGKPNTMTIGWATAGIIWGRPMMLVFVRPSRHTYRFIEECDSFTVCLPPPDMADTAKWCGTVSGRDHDKFAEKNLTAVRGKRVSASYIEECVVHFECKTVHKNHVLPQLLDSSIDESLYGKGDYHVIYYGEIAGCFADEGFDARR